MDNAQGLIVEQLAIQIANLNIELAEARVRINVMAEELETLRGDKDDE